MDPSVIAAALAALSAIVSTVLMVRGNIRAIKVDEKKVDQAAYDRAIGFYQKQLDDATKQIDRVTSQMDKLNIQLEKVSTQLGVEQDVSNTLRSQVRVLQTQVEILTGTIDGLRARLGERLKHAEVK